MTVSFELVAGRPPLQSVPGLHPGRKMYLRGDTIFARRRADDTPVGLIRLCYCAMDNSLDANPLNGAPPPTVYKMERGIYRLDMSFDQDAGFWAEVAVL